MPTIIACFKWVVDEAYIRRGAGGALDLSSVDYKIGEYDRNAIEEAARLRDAGGGGSVIGITVGAPDSAKGVKDGLSRGMDQAFFVSDPSFKDLEPSQTAAILAEVIRTRIPKYDLITCGEGSPASASSRSSPSKAKNSLPTGVSRTASRLSRRRFPRW
jgi:electron transfer flavoprotein beta subunit